MALGGDETGKNMAVDEANAIMSAASALNSGNIAIPTGIMIVLAAVLLMIFETIIVRNAKMNIITSLLISNETSFWV